MKRKLLKILSIMTSIFFSLAIYDVTFTYADSNTIYFGDINGDSCINAVDASAVLAYYAQISTDHEGGFDKSQQLAADINCDGSINAVDASIILAYYAYCSVHDNVVPIIDYIDLSTGTYFEKNIVAAQIELSQIPTYTESAFTTVNNNIPYFSPDDFNDVSFEYYSELDDLGRCGVCMACIGKDIMPTDERGSIGMIKPSGSHLDKYDIVDGKYLYNRCHLIGYQLTGENANPKNLITGTRYLNVVGMLPFENQTASYINKTNNHVLYRVTPVFNENDLLCKGVLMEAWSLEDNGLGICFNVFCYNVQPGISIDYFNGDSCLYGASVTTSVINKSTTTTITTTIVSGQYDYVANKKSKIFHLPFCSSVNSMNEENKIYHKGEREQLIANGYTPCKKCCP